MCTFIRLTDMNGHKFLINADKISMVTEKVYGSNVVTNENFIPVIESLESIENLIHSAKHADNLKEG